MNRPDVIQRLRRLGYGVRRSPSGEARAGRGGRSVRPVTRQRLLPEVEQGAEAAVFSCGWSLEADRGYDFDGSERGPEPWVLVQYTLSGAGVLHRGGREWACLPGTLLVLPMPDRHRYRVAPASTWEFAYVSLRGAAPRRAAARFLAACGPVVALPSDHVAPVALLEVVADLLAKEAFTPHALSERGYGLAMRLLEWADQAQPSALPSPYHELAAWCQTRLAHVTVADCARRHGQSREHFSRCFRAVCGHSPGRFLAELRQSAALAALRAGATPTLAARAAGLRSVAGLQRALRRRLGWAPGSA